MRKLNLGSGDRKRLKEEGWINIDISDECNPDIVRDIERGLPFDSDSVDEVYASHVIEHLDDVFFFMREVWRVCKKDAIVELRFPRWDRPEVAWDFAHKRIVTPVSFEMFKPGFTSVAGTQRDLVQGCHFIKIREKTNPFEMIVWLKVIKLNES